MTAILTNAATPIVEWMLCIWSSLFFVHNTFSSIKCNLCVDLIWADLWVYLDVKTCDIFVYFLWYCYLVLGFDYCLMVSRFFCFTSSVSFTPRMSVFSGKKIIAPSPPPQEPVCLWLGLQLLFSPKGPISEKKKYSLYAIFNILTWEKESA